MSDPEEPLKVKKRLVQERGVHRTRITVYAKKVTTAIQDDDQQEAEAMLDVVEVSHARMEDLSSQIRGMFESDQDAEKDMEGDMTYLSTLTRARAAVRTYLEAKKKPTKPTPLPVSSPVRLEGLSLPTFSGDATKFPGFWTIFKTRVHQDPNLTSAEKFSYLLTKLKGSALSIVEGLPLTDTGYDSAYKLVLERYGKRMPLLNSHIMQLMEIPPSESMEAHHLRKLSDHLRVSVRSLETLGVKLKNNSQVLGPILISKLPLALRVKWQELLPHQEDTIDDDDYVGMDIEKFLTFIAQEAEHRELGRPSKSGRQDPAHHERKSKFGATYESQTSSTCIVCNDGVHQFKDCALLKSQTLKARRETVRRHRLCWNCMSTRHSVGECQSKYTCRRCGNRHHTLLCSKEESDPPKVDSDKSSGKRRTDLKFSGHSYMCSSSSDTPGIYPTVIAVAQGQTRDLRVRLLLDGCSNHSFVSPAIVDKLKIPATGSAYLNLQVFGKGRIVKQVDICNISLKPLHGGETVDLEVSVHDVCQPLDSTRVPIENYSHLSNLPLSECYRDHAPKTVDVLVGHHQMYDILTGRIQKGPRGTPVALESRFGWLLHGPYGLQELCSGKTNVFHVQANSISLKEAIERLSDCSLALPEVDAPLAKPILSDGRFTVGLPWKEDNRPLSNLRQTTACQKKVYERCNAKLLADYQKYFSEYEDLGIISPCSSQVEQAFYLPHHAIHQKGKLRVVFNGSFGSPSLNQLLHTGPNLLARIPSCLTTFRLHSIPLVADIEKAFLQVGISEVDRDFVRFLICREGKLVSYRFNRVPFGLCCSPALLNTCLHELYLSNEATSPAIVSLLRQSMYCDDLVTSVATQQDRAILQQRCTQMFDTASFNLRSWTSSPEKVLGLRYDGEKDSLLIDVSLGKPSGFPAISRRTLFKTVARIFDPLGLALPCVLSCKLLLQKTWSPGTNWDTPLPSSIQAEWNQLQSLYEGVVLSIPRHLCYNSNAVLHAFSDASHQAYSTCLYLVNGQFSTLLFARNRLVPAKNKLSTPRLELMGAVLSVRAVALMQSSVSELSNLRTVFWTDSHCVLAWLNRSPLQLKLFVKNRVNEIQARPGSEWKYVPGHQNPADIPTRGATPSQISHPSRWTVGPDWLSKEDQWPSQPPFVDAGTEELRTVKVLVILPPVDSKELQKYILCFSNLNRLVRSAAWIIRFGSYLTAKQKGLPFSKDGLSYEELQRVRQRLFQFEQRRHFSEEYNSLVETQKVSRSSPILPLHPSLGNNGLIYATPRTGEPPLILLPSDSHIARLLVWECHYKSMHAGVDYVMSALQRTYWIRKLRRLCRSQLSKCVSCKRHHGKPYAHTEGGLSPFRTSFSKPFDHTGMDFAGPIQLSDSRSCYIMIFTCACIRAVHLEVTWTQNTEDTELAMRRFMGRRGNSLCFYSDNAPTFYKLSRRLSLPWKFIPAYSPWWGGWWERLIGLVKFALRKTLHLCLLNDEQFRTVLVELEGVINQRPLTYCSDQPDSVSPLTPAQFLSADVPLCEPWIGSTASFLRNSRSHAVLVSNRLIHRWKHEYLHTLRAWRNADTPGRLPSVGDVVLVKEGPRRAKWPLAVVAKVISREVLEIRLRGNLTRRASKLVYPLEADPPWEQGAPRLFDQDAATQEAQSSVPDNQSDEAARNPTPEDQSDEVAQAPDDQLDGASAVPARISRRGRAIKLPARYLD